MHSNVATIQQYNLGDNFRDQHRNSILNSCMNSDLKWWLSNRTVHKCTCKYLKQVTQSNNLKQLVIINFPNYIVLLIIVFVDYAFRKQIFHLPTFDIINNLSSVINLNLDLES